MCREVAGETEDIAISPSHKVEIEVDADFCKNSLFSNSLLLLLLLSQPQLNLNSTRKLGVT